MRVLIDTNVVFDVFDAHQVKICLNLGIKDSEDALQIAAAMEWKASFIITGNVRDFKRSPIPALAPAAWIKRVRAGPWQLTELLRMRHRSTAHHDERDVNQALFQMPSRFDEGRVVSSLPNTPLRSWHRFIPSCSHRGRKQSL